MRELTILFFLSVAGLLAADTPAPVAKPVPVPEIDVLKVQVQDRDLSLLDGRFQMLQLQMNVMRADAERAQKEYKALEIVRGQAIDRIFAKAKLARENYDLDLEGRQLIPHQKPAVVAAK